MKKTFFLTLFFFTLVSNSPFQKAFAAERLSWKTLSPGLEETQLKTNDSKGSPVTLQLYKIDLNRFKLQVAQAKDYGAEALSAKDLVTKSGALLGLNAGFFDVDFKPLGLLVREGTVLNPLRSVSWWAIFSIDRKGAPKITAFKDFQLDTSIDTAVQVGPRILENGSAISAKPNVSQKTFMGITPKDEIVLGVTDHSYLDANDLPSILANQVGLVSALSFDGGSSTQLYVKLPGYEKEILGYTPVANGIVVLPKH